MGTLILNKYKSNQDLKNNSEWMYLLFEIVIMTMTKKHDITVYYEKNYKKRNDILLSLINPYIPENCVVLDIAAGSAYVASRLLENDKIKKYYWNDINEEIIQDVNNRINDTRFEIKSFDANKPKINFEEINLFISISLEHIEKDLKLIKNLNKNTLIAICSPNFDSKQHVRFFENMETFEKRYSDLIDITANATIINKISENKIRKKFVICGFKK